MPVAVTDRKVTAPWGFGVSAGQGVTLPDFSVLSGLASAIHYSEPLRSSVGTGTFTRASSATFFDRVSGDITSATTDAPCFEEAGLLMEVARTNQVTATTPSNASGWANVGSTATLAFAQSVEACPGRTGTSCKVTMGSVAGGLSVVATPPFLSADSAIGCFSIYVVGVGSSIGKVADIAIYDVTATAVLGIAQVTLTANPQRVSVVGSATTATNAMLCTVGMSTAFGGSSNLAEGDYFYVDVGQYETGAGPSSPILTTGTAATRTAPTLTFPTSVLPAYTGDYSIAMTVKLVDGSTSGHGMYSADGETTRRAVVDASDHKLYTVHPNATASTNALSHDITYRIVTSVDVDGNVVTYVNGAVESTTTAAAFSGTMTDFYLAGYVGGTQPLHGWVKDFKVYSKAVDATEAQYA